MGYKHYHDQQNGKLINWNSLMIPEGADLILDTHSIEYTWKALYMFNAFR